jgi:arylsulfatase A-like enzyme
MKRIRSTNALLALAFVVVGMGCSKSESPDAVFLIVVDTLRPDRLSCYGEERYQTPGADALAAAGVRFDRAQSVASWTIPSMGAMLTSLYPTQLGLVEAPSPPGHNFEWRARRDQRWHTIAYDETTLAERMSAAGYRTAAFVNQPGINATDGFAQGFEDYFHPVDAETIARSVGDRPTRAEPWTPFLRQAFSIEEQLAAHFDDWLGERGGEKVFVWIHLLQPHAPYTPPEWAKRRHSEKRYGGSSFSYECEVIAVDSLVGRIVSSIDEHVPTERSLVVFTSDHGEAFGEHGMREHGHSLHSEVIHVPLIIRYPGAPAGGVVDRYVRNIDILPTILDVTGIGVGGGLRGESLVPLLAGGGEHRPVYAEAMLYGSTERAYLDAGMKLMYDAQEARDKLYDVFKDPDELEDLAPAGGTSVERHRVALDDMYVGLSQDFVKRAGSLPHSAEQTEEIQKAMKALGYIGGDD